MIYIKRAYKFFLFIFLSISLCIVGLYIYAYLTPKTIISKANTYYIYDKNEKLVYQGSSTKHWVKLKDVSPYYIDAVISAEDKNFYKHNGFDYLRIFKAIFKNVKNKKIVEGASTISQQYIKNLYQNFDKTWKRKWNETLLTLNLEVHYSKDDILEGYINTINFGQGNIGIYNASIYYFNKAPKDLSLEESLILAGIPKNPSNYNPVSNYDNSINRAKVILKYMIKNKKITKERSKDLFKDKVFIYGQNEKENLNMLMYYQDAVLKELNNEIQIPKEIIGKKGIKIYTNLDLEVQKELEKNIYNYMAGEDMQVASIITNPTTGGIIALTGGLDYSKSQFNRAINSKRQVGSTMKSFLYYAALENNLTSASSFSSEPSTFTMEDNKEYSPQNYGDKYAYKNISMASAIALSDNIYAVKTNLFLGGERLIDVVHKSGIRQKLKNIPSLPLGTIEMNMLDYAQGYNTLANEGIYKKLHFINRVEDSDGNILYEYDDKNFKEVLNPCYTYILSELLSNTYNPMFKDYTNPTALVIGNKLDEKYAIKTGTTNTDFWTIGYNKDKLMLVWVGNDDGSEVSSSKSLYTKNIFADTVKVINNNNFGNTWYQKPENVVATMLDATTGENTSDNSKAALYYFLEGSEVIPINAEKKEE